MTDTANDDEYHQLLVELYRTSQEANRLISSMPNIDLPAVERVASRLRALRDLFIVLDDEHTTQEKQDELTSYVNKILTTLDQFIEDEDEGAFVPAIPMQEGGNERRRGRKAYRLDLQAALELHNLGNGWKSVAKAMGVARSTLYQHMNKAGLSTARKEHTAISDEDLDNVVKEIHQEHPFIGCRILQGHLETRGIHIARLRVQDSLRRVDAIGVLLR